MRARIGRSVFTTIILTWLTIQLSSQENRRRHDKYQLDIVDE